MVGIRGPRHHTFNVKEAKFFPTHHFNTLKQIVICVWSKLAVANVFAGIGTDFNRRIVDVKISGSVILSEYCCAFIRFHVHKLKYIRNTQLLLKICGGLKIYCKLFYLSNIMRLCPLSWFRDFWSFSLKRTLTANYATHKTCSYKCMRTTQLLELKYCKTRAKKLSALIPCQELPIQPYYVSLCRTRTKIRYVVVYDDDVLVEGFHFWHIVT